MGEITVNGITTEIKDYFGFVVEIINPPYAVSVAYFKLLAYR